MNIEVKDISTVKKEIRIVVPKDIIDEKFEQAYKNVGKKAKIKGFRPGKAPKHIVKKSYQGVVIQDLFQEIINETYYKAITDKKIFPISQPKIQPKELEEGKDFEYTATIDVKPELTNLKYKDLKLKKDKLIVDDEHINKELENLRNKHATTAVVEDKEAKVKNGDIVKMDFEGFWPDGTPLENGSGNDQTLEVGSNQLIKTLEEGLVGLKADEEKTISATFPKDYAKEDLQGKVIDFKVKIKEISTKTLPELNDEFAKSLSDYKDLNDLKEKTKRDLEQHKEQSIMFQLKQDIAAELIKANDFEVPESVVEEQKKRLVEEANMRLAYIGKENLEKYIQENDGQFSDQATSNVKLFFLFEEITKTENLEISDNDIEEEIRTIAEKSPQSFDEIKSYYKKHGIIEDLKYKIKEDKIYNLIMENATIKEKKPEKE
jgi:trigger factor